MPQRPIEERDAVALVFRDATPADVPALLAMINASYLASERGLFAKERTSRDELMRAIGGTSSIVIAEGAGGAMLGSLRLELSEQAHFGLLATELSQQGRGIGLALVREAERRAIVRGYAEISIECIGEVGLDAWYERLGYELTDTEHEPLTSARSRVWGATRPWSMHHMRKALR